MSLKIVHIGKATAGTEVEHIKYQRDAGNEVYVYAPGQNTYEQLMRRIIDADEIHIFAADMPFELGMVYFFSLHALHHKLNWSVRVFCNSNPTLRVFQRQQMPVCAHPKFKAHAGCDKCETKADCAECEL